VVEAALAFMPRSARGRLVPGHRPASAAAIATLSEGEVRYGQTAKPLPHDRGPDDKIGIDAMRRCGGRQIVQFADRLDRRSVELLHEQLPVPAVHGRCDAAVARRARGKQSDRRHSVKLAIPGDCQSLCGGDPDPNSREAAWADPDKDPVRAAAVEHFVEHWNESLAVAPADHLNPVRQARAVAIEERGTAGCSRCVDGQDHLPSSTHWTRVCSHDRPAASERIERLKWLRPTRPLERNGG
jgi:hypothetical protein